MGPLRVSDQSPSEGFLEADHSTRVAWLEDLATVSGFETKTEVFRRVGLWPDVARFNPISQAFFVAEAKHTETPGNQETFWRLLKYRKVLAGC